MIKKVSFGKIVINGKEYGDVIIIANKVFERDRSVANREFGTSHRIATKEINMLKNGNPDIIIIGTGIYGALEVTKEDIAKLEEAGVKVIVKYTKEAADEVNKFLKAGKKVNALLHSTC